MPSTIISNYSLILSPFILSLGTRAGLFYDFSNACNMLWVLLKSKLYRCNYKKRFLQIGKICSLRFQTISLLFLMKIIFDVCLQERDN